MSDRVYRGQVSSVSSGSLAGCDSVLPVTLESHNSLVRTPFRVLLDYMESPMSQESIHMLVEDSRCHTEVSERVYRGVRPILPRSGQLGQFRQLDWV